ncbi:hypothetical protein EYF80_033640 [Liparis tanakae]|uniref:Uncharacterized protein n=1 Tax=Liparis tanakae TaxID=230148 RepID=A0A4Z2GST7_9TELE|nr:hypothetical protein EYF80_033640 [Liparis tanakae]
MRMLTSVQYDRRPDNTPARYLDLLSVSDDQRHIVQSILQSKQSKFTPRKVNACFSSSPTGAPALKCLMALSAAEGTPSSQITFPTTAGSHKS